MALQLWRARTFCGRNLAAHRQLYAFLAALPLLCWRNSSGRAPRQSGPPGAGAATQPPDAKILRFATNNTLSGRPLLGAR